MIAYAHTPVGVTASTPTAFILTEDATAVYSKMHPRES